MPLQLRPISEEFVAEATGVDLARPLAPAEIAAIHAAMDRYAVLVFPNQPLEQEQQVAMSRQFGPLDPGLKKLKKAPERLREFELIDISNVDDQGRPLDRESRKVVSSLANQFWHSDSSFQSIIAQYSLLSAVVLPSWGGETEYADLRAAWDALPERLKREVEDRDGEHDALHSRGLLGDTEYTAEQRAIMPPVVWPLVRTHPGSGRKLLFAGIHIHRILGMPLAEGRMLLADLLEHATQRRFVYTHHWKVGDLVMWDNRATLHRGRRYDLTEPRELRRTTTVQVAEAVRSVA